jgi:hypothetical protein
MKKGAGMAGRSMHSKCMVLVLCCPLLLGGCKWVRVSTDNFMPKQGDTLQIKISAGESDKIDKVDYQVDGSGTESLESGTLSWVPYTTSVNTCKNSGNYITALQVHAEATYEDGVKKTTDRLVGTEGEVISDLTVCNQNREDIFLLYAIYVAHDSDEDREDLRIAMANAFMDAFHSYSRSQYYWSSPSYYQGNSLHYADSVDMAISFGHGKHHCYRAGSSTSDRVYMNNTAFGGCAHCNNVGDLEYLVFASCKTLSMDDSDGISFWYYWFHQNSTKLDPRPFTGLHMVLGFRTTHRIAGDDSEEFFESFAENLDDGMHVIDAWQEAAGDELSFSDGKNRTAVFYLKEYENDTIDASGHDYIYGNVKYGDQWYDTWE